LAIVARHDHQLEPAVLTVGSGVSGVTGTPTFFINGRRHYGAYDINTLSAVVRAAGARALLARPDPSAAP
jgi:hypothetical protein